MKVSLSWLNEYVPVDMEASVLAEALTMAGLEVEAITDRYAYLSHVFVGRIFEVVPHPNSDNLKLCQVNVGDRVVSVVCGAPNVKKGMTSPLAMPGTVFPNGSVLNKNVIRGILSEGMLCSEAELGLGVDKSGIMTLGDGLIPGKTLVQALSISDMVFEIGLTPNRPDCLSIIGIAREAAAIQRTRLTLPEVSLSDSGDRISDLTSVSIEAPDHCPRYAARILEKVTISPSPFWLQDRLMSVGLRPINNIVDVTNFVMMETGQPLHAFDFDRLAENRIVVRTANEGESFVTLDDKERNLTPEMLMICDGQRPVAIGGVMGGQNTEIEESTTRVLIESAYFSPVSVRKTSKQLGLSTEASHRFERGVDPCGTVSALNRAAQLMKEVSKGTVVEGVIDEHPKKTVRKPIKLSVRDTNRLLGTKLDCQEIKNLLTSIEFSVSSDQSSNDSPDNKTNNRKDRDKIVVSAPSFRVDILRPVDLMEEVARLLGYNHIPTTFPMTLSGNRHPQVRIDLREKIRQLMTGFGFTEVITYSFINKLSCDWLRLAPDDPKRRQIHILNPLTEDQTVMRTSLAPGLFGTMHRNLAQQVRTLKLFEVGKIFIHTDPNHLPEESEIIAGLWTGSRFATSWHFQETECDFYDIKGGVEGLLNGLNVSDIRFTQMPVESCSYTRPGHTAEIISQNKAIGLIGEIDRQVLNNFDLKQKTFFFELNLDRLLTCIPDTIRSQSIPKFPSISRDMTIIINREIEAMRIVEHIQEMGEKLVEDILLFDIFEGDPIPSGKKSISLRIVYRSLEETLADDVVNPIHQTIAERLIQAFQATLPV